MTTIIDGKEISKKLREDLNKEIKDLKNKYNAVPGLAVVQVGNVAASSVYVKAKTKAAKEVGIEVPLVVRLEGTNVELGKKMLDDSDLNITTATTMKEAASTVVSLI